MAMPQCVSEEARKKIIPEHCMLRKKQGLISFQWSLFYVIKIVNVT
jgi:hypothetical protein